MSIKNYYLKTERNLGSELTYIKQTYSAANPRAVGLFTGNIILAKLDFATQNDEENFIEDMASRGVSNFWIENQYVNLSLYQQNSKDNRILWQVTQNVPLNTLSTSYVDVFPAIYSGIPIPIDTYGYRKMGMILLWNKNGGSGTHSVKLVKCNANGVITQPEQILRESNVGHGYNRDFDYDIPQDFQFYRGFVKLQAKSSNGTDSPRFDGLWLYNIRR